MLGSVQASARTHLMNDAEFLVREIHLHVQLSRQEWNSIISVITTSRMSGWTHELRNDLCTSSSAATFTVIDQQKLPPLTALVPTLLSEYFLCLWRHEQLLCAWILAGNELLQTPDVKLIANRSLESPCTYIGKKNVYIIFCKTVLRGFPGAKGGSLYASLHRGSYLDDLGT